MLVGSIIGDVAFVGIDGHIFDLDTLIDPSLNLNTTQALAINDSGQILALAHSTVGATDSVVLLTPPHPRANLSRTPRHELLHPPPSPPHSSESVARMFSG